MSRDVRGGASYRIFHKPPSSSQFAYRSIALYICCTCCISLISFCLLPAPLYFIFFFFHSGMNIACIYLTLEKFCIDHTNTNANATVIITVFTADGRCRATVAAAAAVGWLADLLWQQFDSMRAYTPIIIMKNVRYKFSKLPYTVRARLSNTCQSEKCEENNGTEKKNYK